MSERPGDDDEQASSDWLAAQFAETGEVPKPPAAPPPPVAAEPPTLVNPFGSVPPAPAAPPPAAPPPAPTAPPAPAPSAPADAAPGGAGFAWGLRPGSVPPSTASAPPASTGEPDLPPVTPAWSPGGQAAAPVPPPLVEPPSLPPTLVDPPRPDPAPTVAWTMPPVESALDGVEPPALPPTEALPFETARLPEVAPDAVDAPSWDQPTQAMVAMPSEPESPAVNPFAGIAAAELLGASALASEPGSTTALDALFGDENFRDYEAEPAPTQAPFARAAVDPMTAATTGPTRMSGTQKVLLAVAGGLVALIALAALFLLGTRLAALAGPAPVATPSSTPTPTPTPTPTVEPVGPVAAGVWAWDELRGGECLDPYLGPWEEEFTVVDCANPHPAQMVVRGTFPPSAEGVTNDPYPGAENLQGQLSLLCTAPGVIDLAAAGQYGDVQFQGAYPATAEQWDEGNRYYYCFVSRSSGEPLTGSVAIPAPVPAA